MGLGSGGRGDVAGFFAPSGERDPSSQGNALKPWGKKSGRYEPNVGVFC